MVTNMLLASLKLGRQVSGFLLIPTLVAAPQQEVGFTEVAAKVGIHFKHQNFATPHKYLVETMGSGAAFLDYDNDGWLDIYLLNGTPLIADGSEAAPNRLYRNNRDGTFREVTSKAGVGHSGYGMGVAVGDYDNDGWIDLYITNFGPNVLYHNRRDGTFKDVTAKAGVGDAKWGASAGFFDYDRDGHLDLYVTNYLDFSLHENVECTDYGMKHLSYCHPDHYAGAADLLYRNNGDGTFSEVGRQAGIANEEGKGLGVLLSDLDRDQWMDIYVANDSVSNFLYRNLENGKFLDTTLPSGTGYNADGKAEAGMGVDAGDVTGDGFPELFVTNLDFETNTFYQRQGEWIYDDHTFVSGLGQPGFLRVGFGTRLVDYDNDGDLDIIVANGHILDNISLSRPNSSYPQLNQLYRNDGGHFKDVSDSSGPAFQLSAVSRGLAVGDYDNDGDLDLLVSNCNGPAHLLRNEGGNGNHWISMKLEGTKSNRSGIGVQVVVQSKNGNAFYELVGGSSYLSAHDLRLHIGLGNAEVVESIEILWPSGTKQLLEKVEVDQHLVVREK